MLNNVSPPPIVYRKYNINFAHLSLLFCRPIQMRVEDSINVKGQWGSQPEKGPPTYYLAIFFPEHWMKVIKTLDRGVKHSSPAPATNPNPPMNANERLLNYIDRIEYFPIWTCSVVVYFDECIFSIKNHHIIISPDTLCIQCTQSQHVGNT